MSSGFNQKPTASPYAGNYLTANAVSQQQSRRASSGQGPADSPTYPQTNQKETSFDQKGSPGMYPASTLSDISPYGRGQVPTIHHLMEENMRNNQQGGTMKNQQFNPNSNFSLGEAESPGYGEEESYSPQKRQSQRAMPNLQVSTRGNPQQNNSYNNGSYSTNQPGYNNYQSLDNSAFQQPDSTFTSAYDRAVHNNNQQGNSPNPNQGIEMTRLGQQEMQSSNKLLYDQNSSLYNTQLGYDHSNMPQTMSNTPLDQKGVDLNVANMQRGHLAFRNANEKGAFLNKKPSGVLRKPDSFSSMPKYLDTKSSEEEVLKLKRTLSKSDTICAIFSVLGILLAFIEENIFWNNGNHSEAANYVLRTMISILSVLTSIFIYRHYSFQLRILKARKIVYQTTSLFNSGLLKKFLLEAIFSLIHTPPGFDYEILNVQLSNKFYISFDAYITFIMLFRLYICFRLFDHYTFWTGQRSVRICKMNGFQANSKFAIKAYLKYRAFTVLIIGLGVSILVFGLGVRLFEKPFTGSGSKYRFNSVWNSFWCIIVTMTTIGYGDIYPSTHFGRLVTILACIWGVFLLSLFVVALNNHTEFTNEESQAFDELSKSQLVNNKLSKDSYLLLQTFLRLKLLQKHKASLKDRFLMRMDMISLASRYRSKRKGVLSQSKSVSDILQEMQDDEEYGVEELINLLAPVKEITTAVENIQTAQSGINSKVLQVHEMSKKLFSFVSGVNSGEVGKISTLKELRVEYDVNGEKVTDKFRGKRTMPNIDARRFTTAGSNTDLGSPDLVANLKRRSPRATTEIRF